MLSRYLYNGQIIAIGAYGNNGNGINSGNVRFFQCINDDWRKLVDDIDGDSSYDNSDFSTATSLDVKIVEIGAYSNDGIDYWLGQLSSRAETRYEVLL